MTQALHPGGRITAITVQKRRRGRRSVFIDDAFAFGVDAETVRAHHLEPGLDLSSSDVEKILLEDEQRKAMTKGYQLLARRAHSRQELEQKLQRAGYPEVVITAAMSQLQAQGYLDEQAFAEAYIRSRLLQRPCGSALLRHELRVKGVPEQDLVTALAKVFRADMPEREYAMKAAQKKLASLTKLDAKEQVLRLQRFLQGRGFDWQDIREVTDELIPEPRR